MLHMLLLLQFVNPKILTIYTYRTCTSIYLYSIYCTCTKYSTNVQESNFLVFNNIVLSITLLIILLKHQHT